MNHGRWAFRRHAGFPRFAAGARSRLPKGHESNSWPFGIGRLPLFLFLVLWSTPATGAGEAPRLDLPVACDMAAPCSVQNYLDMAPGPEARDHTCGTLTYDGHNGIDIRIPTRRDLRIGVEVRAAAPGVVTFVRDKVPDAGLADPLVWPEGLDPSGNSVRLDHGGGWETQYSHLKQGSVEVRAGQSVAAGQRLGEIGLSGRTSFPHLDFMLLGDGAAVDPFTGARPDAGCGLAGTGLWSAEAATALAYRPGGQLGAGFAGESPTLSAALDGAYPEEGPPPDDPPLLAFWAAAWGLQAGDRERIRLLAPDGAVLAETSAILPGTRAEWFRYVGRRRPEGGWPPGPYRGDYLVERQVDGQWRPVVEASRETRL